MTGTIELDRDGRTLLIRFPYREDLVDEVDREVDSSLTMARASS